MRNSLTSTPDTTATVLSQPNALSTTAAKTSLVLAAGFVFILALLHLVKPEIDPSWRFISEYATGKFGWLMSLAFIMLAASYISLFFAVRPLLNQKLISRLGLGLLLLSATGLLIAGLFTTDPLNTPASEQSLSGKLHNLGGALGMAMPFASLLICVALFNGKIPGFVKWPVLWVTVFALLGFFVAISSLAFLMTQSGGRFGPDVPVGWPNRFEILAYCTWLMVVARQLRQRKLT